MKRQVVHKNVVFIDKTKLTFVVLPDKSIKEYIYPQDMVMDGDVMKKDDFRNAFITWLSESGIKVADSICIVNKSAVFEKIITPDPKSRTTDVAGTTAFIESIPFQHVATVKKQLKDNSVKVLVANRDLLSSIYHGLEKSAYNMLGIFPELSLTTDNAVQMQGIDIAEQAKRHLTLYTLKNTQQYIFDIFPHSHKSLTQMSVSEAAQQGVGVWYMQYYQVRQGQIALARKRAQLLAEQQSVQTADSNPTDIKPVSALVSETPVPTSSATESAELSPTPKLLRVQILYTTQAQKLFDDVYNKIRQAGKYQISNQISSRELGENRILFSPSLDTSSTVQITDLVTEVGVQATTKQAVIDGFDIVIELGLYSPVAPIEDTPTPTP
jgi:hypothetical protein